MQQLQPLKYIYFRMSSRLDSTNFRTNKSNDNLLCCETCSHLQTDLLACKLCCVFCCDQCSKNRLCPNGTLDSEFCLFEKIEQMSLPPLELNKKSSDNHGSRHHDSPNSKNQPIRSCQRCYLLPATRECLTCMIRSYCDQCFRLIHNSRKFTSHQSIQIKQNKQKTANLEKLQFRLRTKSSHSNFNTCQTRTLNDKESVLARLESSLNFVRNSYQQELANHQNEVSKCITNISREFETLIEQVKLKIIEISLKIAESSREGKSRYEEKNAAFSIQEKNIINLRILTMRMPLHLPLDIIELKLEKCDNQITQMASSLEWSINLTKDPLERRGNEITQQIQQIRSMISRISLKKRSFQLETPKNSSPGIATARDEKSNFKSMKFSLNLNACKSIDKSLTMSLITPKKGQGNPFKSHKQFEVTAKSLYNSQTAVNSPQDETVSEPQPQKILKFGSNKKPSQIKLSTQNSKDKKQPKLQFMSPKASIKKFQKHMEINTKTKISKIGGNMQKTKKMIKQLRSEMMQLTSRRNSQAFENNEIASQLPIESIVSKLKRNV